MAQIFGKHGIYPPQNGWDLKKVQALAFKPMAEQEPDENEYLSMWLQTTPQVEVIGRLREWEAQDPNRPENMAEQAAQRDARPVGKALYYTPEDLAAGRVNPDDLAR